MKPVYVLSIPEYRADSKPNYTAVGSIIDNTIKDHFSGKIALRYLSMQDHPDISLDKLIKIIDETGTDKYAPGRKMSVAHDFYSEKGVGLFAVPAEISPKLNISKEALKDFYEGAIHDRGYSLRIDLVVIYDLNLLESIPIQYVNGVGKDAYKFRKPNQKEDAVLGFIKLL